MLYNNNSRNYRSNSAYNHGVSFTLLRSAFYQLIAFPLLLSLSFIASLFAFPTYMLTTGKSGETLNYYVFFSLFSLVASALIAVFLASKINSRAKDQNLASISLLFFPLVNLVAVLITNAIGGYTTPEDALRMCNMQFLIPNIITVFIAYESTVFVNIFAHLGFSLVFYLVAYRHIRLEPKIAFRVFNAVVALIMSALLLTAVAVSYVDLEYEVLKLRYDQLRLDDVDYNFALNLPFNENNQLIKLNQPQLDFPDIHTSPRLDGATAFYPIFASIIESCYSGLKREIDERGICYYSGYQNVYLDLSDNDSQSNRLQSLLACSQTASAYHRLALAETDVVFAFEPNADQIGFAQERGVEFEYTLLGYDAFCFFVSAENPVDNLTLEQIQGIYSGKITNWRKVGGKNKRIFAFTRPKNSGSQTAMENLVMKDIAISTRFEPQEVRTMGGMIAVVDGYLNTPNAIGYTFMYYSSSMVKGESIKYLAINGIAPSMENVRTGAYLFCAPFYAVTLKGQDSMETTALLDWLVGAEGQSLIEKIGYVTL